MDNRNLSPEDREHTRKLREALQPYADIGMPFPSVVNKTRCPWTLQPLYEQMLQERDSHPEQLGNSFLDGFMADPTMPIQKR